MLPGGSGQCQNEQRAGQRQNRRDAPAGAVPGSDQNMRHQRRIDDVLPAQHRKSAPGEPDQEHDGRQKREKPVGPEKMKFVEHFRSPAPGLL